MNRFAATAALVLLSCCTEVNSHVSGSFACKAPQGTCAPTLVIDDGALAKMDRDGNAAAPKRAPSAQAAPTTMPDGGVYRAREAHIVFPAYTDDKGRRHDAYGVYVTLNDARFTDPAASAQSPLPISALRSVRSSTNLVTAASTRDGANGPPPVTPATTPPGQSALVVQRVDPPGQVADTQPVPGSTSAPAQTFPASTVQP